MRSRSLVAILALAAALAGVAHYLVFTSDRDDSPIALALLAPLLGLAFVVSGTIARSRHPENRTGTLMIFVGFAWFLGALAESDDDLLFTIGLALGALAYAPYAHLVYSFPTGRLGSRLTRFATALAYVDVLVLQIALMLFDPEPQTPDCDCPQNLLLVREDGTLAAAIATIQRLLGLGLLALALYLLFRRWRSATPAARRVITPVIAAITPSLVLIAALLVVAQASEDAAQPVYWALLVAWLAVPLAFLLGVFRSRLARAGVGRLLVETPDEPSLAEAQDALRRTLNDPTLQLAYWLPETGGYVDADGKPYELPDPTATCVTTRIEYEDRPVAALVHDAVLLEEPELLEEAAAVVRIGLEKDRGLRALRASEARSRALLAAIPDNMFRIRADGIVLDRSVKGSTGRGRPEPGSSIYQMPRQDIAELVMRAARVALMTDEAQTIDYACEVDGMPRQLEGRVVKSADDEVVLIERDVTQRRLQDEALRESDERNRALVEAIPDNMYVVRRDGTFVDFEHKRPTVTLDFRGHTIHDLMPGDAAERLMRCIAEALATGEGKLVDYSVETEVGRREFETRIVRLSAEQVLLIERDVTARVEREQALRRSEERNQALLDAIPDVMFRYSRDGTFLDVNAKEGLWLLGDPEKVIGKNVREVLPPELAEAALDTIQRALDEGLQSVEYPLETALGVRQFEGRLTRSGPDEVVMIVRDVTERKRQEEELRTSEARTRALLDAIPDLMFRIDRDGRYLDYKAHDTRDLYNPEVIGLTVWNRLPRHVADELMSCAEQALREGTVKSVEYDLDFGGATRHYEGRIVAATPDEFLLIVRDITDRKRQAQVLERERDFIRTVVQSAPTLFCLVEADGKIMTYNRTVERVLGYADAEAVRGRRFWEVFPAPDDAEDVRAAFEAVTRGGEPTEHEHRLRTHSGDLRTVAWSATPIIDADGIQRYLLSGLDITERKRQEQEIAASRARIVRAADEERRRLERNLHDGAQQRLVAMSLSLRLAQAKLPGDPDAARELIEGTATELQQALEELRELARGIHPALLTERGLDAALESLATRSPVPVTMEVPPERLPEPVEAAAYYVVSEALANVAKYAEASEVDVRVARENGRVVIEVRDDGVGGADPGDGTGLRGLIDRVSALEGTLAVESPHGEGTRLRAEIPLREPALHE